jgi:hypothetical protein
MPYPPKPLVNSDEAPLARRSLTSGVVHGHHRRMLMGLRPVRGMADRFPLQPEFLTAVGILLGIERPSVLGDLGGQGPRELDHPSETRRLFPKSMKVCYGKNLLRGR